MHEPIEKVSSLPFTATQWVTFAQSQSGEFDALEPVERHRRLVEHCLYSKAQGPLDSEFHPVAVDFPEDQL
jgi:hypothetical protein